MAEIGVSRTVNRVPVRAAWAVDGMKPKQNENAARNRDDNAPRIQGVEALALIWHSCLGIDGLT
jgi:hypothetical protein